MLTARESAASIYGAVRGMGRGWVRGADMAEVTAERLALLDEAATLIDRAVGTEHRFAAEPNDPQLVAMGERVARIRAEVSACR